MMLSLLLAVAKIGFFNLVSISSKNRLGPKGELTVEASHTHLEQHTDNQFTLH
jgi:hypothetical protein